MGNVLALVEQEDELKNDYWIGIELIAAGARPLGERILLGPRCKTIAELDKLISEIQADLRSLTAEGHVKMAYHQLKVAQREPKSRAR